MQFSKLRSGARFNLSGSGMFSYPLRKLGLSLEDLEINGENAYGYPPLKEAIAHRYQVDADHVVTAAGTSFANYLALAAVAEPGEEILVEWPTYELILSTAEYLGLKVRRFRRNARTFEIDLDSLADGISPDTRAIVLCNMHNPSSQFTDETTLNKIGEMARRVRAKVIVDEVYRELLWEDKPRSVVRLDEDTFISTSSLTKAYGLSGIRCGWVLASRELCDRMWRINDLHAATPVHPGELIATRAFARLDTIQREMKEVLDKNRARLHEWLKRRPELSVLWPQHGTVVFPRLVTGDVDEFAEFFRMQFDGSIVPGRYFEMPDHLRIGVGLSTEEVEASLLKLGEALESFSCRQADATLSAFDRRS